MTQPWPFLLDGPPPQGGFRLAARLRLRHLVGVSVQRPFPSFWSSSRSTLAASSGSRFGQRPFLGARGQLRALSLFVLFALPASAATSVRETRRELMTSSVDRVLGVLGSSEVCATGCKYPAPFVVKETKVGHRATAGRYFKWTHVDNVKETRFFTEVSISPGATTKVRLRTLTKEKDAALIAELEQKTGLPHQPIFDVAVTTYTMTEKDGQLEVTADATTTVSGFAALFPGKVKDAMRESFAATFANFKR